MGFDVIMDLEDIRIYLPKYLSAKEEDELFSDLRNFPDNIENRMYSSIGKMEGIIYQGDGINGLLFINFPDLKTGAGKGLIISNTCDVFEEHKRIFYPHICYSPIFNLKKYRQAITESGKYSGERIESHISAIKKQQITQIFYLPSNGTTIEDSIVFLDRINNCKNEYIDREKLGDIKLFTLSNYGFYIFLIKLSIHFTRIRENVNRT